MIFLTPPYQIAVAACVGFVVAIVTLLAVWAFRRKRASKVSTASNVDMLAHEIRTPLSLIKGSAELLEAAGPLTDEQRRFVDTIQSNSENAIRVAEDFLTLAKLDATGGTLTLTTFDLRELTRDTARELRTVHNFPILLTDPGEPLPIRADRALVKHVLWNLMNNAVRHAGINSQILVRTYATSNQYGIEVRDAGPGMTPDTRESLFQPFTQATEAPIATGAGAGLGMSIVARIVELHHGTVLVDTLSGRGTSIHVLLPADLDVDRRYS